MPNHTEAKRIGRNQYQTERLSTAGCCLLSPEQIRAYRPAPEFLWVRDETGFRLLPGNEQMVSDQFPPESEGFGWIGQPEIRISALFSKPVYLSVILQDVAQLAAEAGITPERPLGIRMQAECTMLEYERSPGGTFHEREDVVLTRAGGFLFVMPEHIPRDDDGVRALCKLLQKYPAGGGVCALLMSPLPETTADEPAEFTALIQPESLISRAEMELFAPHRSCDAADFLIP